jgi:PAS domain S-box-containing protein
MLHPSAAKTRSTGWLYPAGTALVAVGIFVVDTFTPLEIAIAVLYAVVVMVSASFLDRRGILLTSGLCIALTIASYVIVHGGTSAGGPLVRALVSLCAIGATTLLAVRNREATRHLADHASLLDLTHDAIVVRDMNGVATYWNAGAERLFGWTREQAIGRNSTELLKTRFPAGLEGILDELRRTDRWNGELVHTVRGGQEVVVASRWSLHRDGRGQPIATLSTNNDITEQRRAEDALSELRAELAHVARVSTLGELTASIAHEVNQPLAAVVANGEAGLRWLSREVPNLPEVRLSMERMIGNARRASEVVARLRALARKEETPRSAFTLNDVVEDILPLVEREFARHAVTLRLDLEPHPLRLFGDRLQIQQVVINLVMNAVQAMADVEDRPRALSIRSARETDDAGGAILEVTDSGVGIDADSVGKLFSPFYSTKGDGMGMGLSICRTIVEAHGGQMRASPAAPHGATFTFRLPTHHEGDT